MKVVMAKNLKRKSVIIQPDGTTVEATVEEYMGNKLGGTPSPNRLPKASEKTAGDEEKKKICLGCSDPAMEGEDYCPSCIKFIK